MILTNNYLLKNWRSEPKKVRVLMLLLHFFLIEKHTLRYDFTHVYLKSWWYDLQFLRIRAWQTKISNYGSVFVVLIPHPPSPPPLTLLKIGKITFWKIKKLLEIHFTHVHQKHIDMRYGFWDRVRQTDFFFLLGHFLSFYSPCNPENQNSLKMKSVYGVVIILYMCTKNHEHMVYASWDMGATHNFL